MDGLGVAEVRRALAALRRGWEEATTEPRSEPLYLSRPLDFVQSSDLSYEAFALRFVLAHHNRRVAGRPEAG